MFTKFGPNSVNHRVKKISIESPVSVHLYWPEPERMKLLIPPPNRKKTVRWYIFCCLNCDRVDVNIMKLLYIYGIANKQAAHLMDRDTQTTRDVDGGLLFLRRDWNARYIRLPASLSSKPEQISDKHCCYCVSRDVEELYQSSSNNANDTQ